MTFKEEKIKKTAPKRLIFFLLNKKIINYPDYSDPIDHNLPVQRFFCLFFYLQNVLCCILFTQYTMQQRERFSVCTRSYRAAPLRARLSFTNIPSLLQQLVQLQLFSNQQVFFTLIHFRLSRCCRVNKNRTLSTLKMMAVVLLLKLVFRKFDL